MPEGRSLTATCTRVPGGWEVRLPALGVSGRSALLTQVEDVARELVRAREQSPTGDHPPRVVVEPLVPARVRALLGTAQRMRSDADSVSVGDVITRRRLARSLVDEGFPVPDVAGLLGVSEARARMLTVGAAVGAPVGAVTPAVPAAVPGDQVVPAGSTHSHRHEALFHDGDDDLLQKAVPFLRDGVVAGEPVLAALPGPRLDLLRRALGADAAGVHLVDLTEVGRNPARILPAWLEFLDEYGGRRPVRGLGQPVWPGRTPAEVVECHLHEALLNVAVDPDRPAWLRCSYDRAALDPQVLDAALCSHPLVVDGGQPLGSTRYAGLAYVEELLSAPLPEPTARVSETTFGPDDVGAVRTLVHRWGREADLGPDRSADLALAVTELATNSIRHGGGSGRLRSWREAGGLAVEVSDAGQLTDPLAGRRAPTWSQEGGRGLWLTNQLCDLVQLRSGAGGTTARVSARSARRR